MCFLNFTAVTTRKYIEFLTQAIAIVFSSIIVKGVMFLEKVNHNQIIQVGIFVRYFRSNKMS